MATYRKNSRPAHLETYVAKKDGGHKLMAPGTVRADGVVVLEFGGKRRPVILASECERLGIDVKDVTLDSPIECLGKLGLNPGGVEIMTLAESTRRNREKLDEVIPGVTEILALANKVKAADDDHYYRRSAEIARGTIMTVGPLDPTDGDRLASLLAANPRGAAYLAACRQRDGAHWADNSGKGAAAERAIEILLAGGSADEARSAMAERRELND